MYFNVNFNVFFKLIKVHLLLSELYILLSSSLLSKVIRIKIYETIVLPADLYGNETWSLTLTEESRLKVF